MGLCMSKNESTVDASAATSPKRNQYGEGRDDNDDLEAVMYLKKKRVLSEDEDDRNKKSREEKYK